jgi:hypothetical protein
VSYDSVRGSRAGHLRQKARVFHIQNSGNVPSVPRFPGRPPGLSKRFNKALGSSESYRQIPSLTHTWFAGSYP